MHAAAAAADVQSVSQELDSQVISLQENRAASG